MATKREPLLAAVELLNPANPGDGARTVRQFPLTKEGLASATKLGHRQLDIVDSCGVTVGPAPIELSHLPDDEEVVEAWEAVADRVALYGVS